MNRRPSHLLISEPPLQVLPSLACQVGLAPAMVLQQLHYVTLRSRSGWVDKKLEEWRAEDFPFWTTRTLKRAFADLRERGLIEVEQPHGTDRRNRYRVDHDALIRLTEAAPSKGTNCPHGTGQIVPFEEDDSSPSNGTDLPVGKGQKVPLSNEVTAEGVEAEVSSASAEETGKGGNRTTSTSKEEVDGALAKLSAELRPFVEPVVERLAEVAAANAGAIAPSPAAVARVLERFPKKDFIPAADDYLHWALHGRGQVRKIRDVVRGYRNWLEKSPPVLRKTPPPGAGTTPAGARHRAMVDDTRRRLEEAMQ